MCQQDEWTNTGAITWASEIIHTGPLKLRKLDRHSPPGGLQAELGPWPEGWCSRVAVTWAQRSSRSCQAWRTRAAGSGCGCKGRRRTGSGSAWARVAARRPWAARGWGWRGDGTVEEAEVREGGSQRLPPALWTCCPWPGCCSPDTDPPAAGPELDSRLRTVRRGRTYTGSGKINHKWCVIHRRRKYITARFKFDFEVEILWIKLK